MKTYIEYDYSYTQTDCLEDCGDVKAIACIDAYPMNADGKQQKQLLQQNYTKSYNI